MPHLARAYSILDDHYRYRPDAVVLGKCYLCSDPAYIAARPYPDLMVAFGMVYPQAEVENANGYTSNELSQPPDFVLEIAAPSPARPDCTIQREIYAPSGVAEYWRFDYTGGDYYGVALAGDRLLSTDVYEPIPIAQPPDGVDRGHRAALGLELHWYNRRLRFGNPSTRADLADLTELRTHRQAITATTAAIQTASATMRAAPEAAAV